MDALTRDVPVRPRRAASAWRNALPWWAKIAGKIALSRLPLSAAAWQKLGLFSSGVRLDPDFAIAAFRRHHERAGSPAAGFSYLELGPGDSIGTAAVAWAHGAAGGWLIDAGAYAVRDIAAYRPLFHRLAELRDELRLRRDTPELQGMKSVGELLATTNATYREDGLKGLRAVPSDSVDFVMSQATLEQVLRRSFAAIQTELHRAMKPGAAASHQVDFTDRFAASLHNLRFDDALWENPWFARRSGFYTNRLRLSEVIAVLNEAGFAVQTLETSRWAALPLPRDRLAARFQTLSDEDLLTSGAALIARKHG